MKTRFETETCSRCHGSGRHSFCERFRDICFKCGGNGLSLTKRGKAARDYLEQISTVPVESLKIGDRIRVRSITIGGAPFEYVGTVTKIEPTTDIFRFRIETVHPKFGTMGTVGAKTFRIYGEENEARIQQALAFQETLTKAGTVKKKKKSEGEKR